MYYFSFTWKIVISFTILLTMRKHILALSSPAPEFSRHRIVRPTIFHARTKREISSTRHSVQKTIHHPDVIIKVLIDNKEYVLDLKLNKDLVSDGHVISYQQDGAKIQYKPNKEELDICQYFGVVRDKPNSWAAVSTCHGVRGVIYDGEQMRYIQPAESDEINSNHYIYDHSDLQTSSECGFDAHVPSTTDYDRLHLHQNNVKNIRARYKREETEAVKFKGPYKSNNVSRYVELVLVADQGTYLDSGDIPSVHRKMQDLANIINSLFSSLNIFIALVGVVVWSENDEIPLNEDGDTVLKKFAAYRLKRLTIKNDNAHLISLKRFGDKVGKAYIATMCREDGSVGITTLHSHVIGLVAATAAHEIGHNFGMLHDDDNYNCKCPDEHCIMEGAISNAMPVHWSSCSFRSLSYGFDKGLDYCLRNKPKSLFEPSTCGNGFLEAGEQCDCGLSVDEETTNGCHACCHPDTCMLKDLAVCATGECCDLKSCRPMSAGTVCRSALKECDLPEHCTGHSEFCPADVFKVDSTPCGTHREAYCVAGSCKSHSDQCRMLWGDAAKNGDDACYSYKNGNLKHDCGAEVIWNDEENKWQWQFKPCASEDKMCGRLRCQSFEPFQFEAKADTTKVNKMRISFEDGRQIQCSSAFVLTSDDKDPGLVPDGAKCGENKMCLKQKCVSVDSVRTEIAARDTSVCPSDCNGHGVCNSEGHCHCEVGFAPPDCLLPGYGGSVDSGPASGSRSYYLSSHDNYEVVIHLILGILPLALC